MASELFDTPNPSSRLSEEVLPKSELIVHNDFELPFLPDEHKDIKRQISLLGRKNNEIHPVNDSLIEIASNIRKRMSHFVVGSFLKYAKDIGVLPSVYSIFSDQLPKDPLTGVDEYFQQSFREDYGVPRKLWDNRWLCTMSNGLRQAQARGKLWTQNRLAIAKDGVLRYSYHLDSSRKDHFPKDIDLDTAAMTNTYPSIEKVHLIPDGQQRGLLTHATQAKNMREILSSSFLAPYRHIRPLSLSEGVASLPHSEKVIIFDPRVLHRAGFNLMRYDENPIDAHEILEVREPLPIPIFLASGIYDTARLHPEAAKGRAFIWSLDEPSAAFGQSELLNLQGKIHEIQK
jgi:hypothetical protein